MNIGNISLMENSLCDEIITRITERDSVCVVEGKNRCGPRARNRITGVNSDLFHRRHVPRVRILVSKKMSEKKKFSQTIHIYF